MKIDPYKHKEKYLKWKDSLNGKISGISEKNSKIFLEYMFDMEQGLNVASGSRKGARSYIRLNNLKQRILFYKIKCIFPKVSIVPLSRL
ncbi:hypothetical protein KAJ87_00630 [Candidatus Pacearchaeota archaeon]|nr:hypothetical protein [Candidatus Pacearchaeota archaeon]